MEVFSSRTPSPSAEPARFAPYEPKQIKSMLIRVQRSRTSAPVQLSLVFLPCFLVHGLMHDKTPVDIQDSLAHVHVLLQKDLDVVGRFQEENIGGVGDENLRGETSRRDVR